MANIPVFPTHDDLTVFKDFVNVQQQMADLALRQKNTYYEIGRISKSVQVRVEQRMAEEKRLLDAQVHAMQDIAKLEKTRFTARQQGLEAQLNQDIASRQAAIKEAQDRIQWMRTASTLERTLAKRQHEEDMKFFNFAKDFSTEHLGMKNEELSLTYKLREQMMKMGIESELIASAIGATLMMLIGAYKNFLKFDTAAWHFRKAMGMTRADSGVLRKNAERLAIEYAHIGVSAEMAYDATMALGEAMGGAQMVSFQMARNVAVMRSQFGIAEKDSVGFMQNLAAVSKSTMQAQEDSMYIAQNIASAAGVGLNTVMQDVAKATGPAVMMLSRVPSIAIKSAIELRRMGTSLKDAAGSSRHILDFTESINEEMEASVLLGQNLNLQRARELAYAGDIVGSQQEMVKRARQIGFESKDIFQKEAVAKAMGMSVEQLLKMLQTERQIEQIRLRGSAEERAALKTYEAMRKANEATLRAKAKDKMATVMQMANQERLVAIQQKWNQLLMKAQAFLFPVIDKLLEGALALVDWAPLIMAFVMPLGSAVKFMAELLKGGTLLDGVFLRIAAWVGKFGPRFAFVEKIVLAVGTKMGVVVSWAGKLLGPLSKTLGFLGKFLGPIGWVIMAFQGIAGFISGWRKAEGGFFSKLFGGIMGALRGIIPGFDYIVKALKWFWGWAGKIYVFMFKWFTPIGLLIQGFKLIKRLFPETFAALGDMFKKVWEFQKKILEGIWQGVQFWFKWLTPIGLVIQGVKKLGGSIGAIWKYASDKVKTFYNAYNSFMEGIRTKFINFIVGGIKKIDHFVAGVIRGISNMATKVFGWIKKGWDSLPWVIRKVLGFMFGGGGDKTASVEKKVAATYHPAVQVTPKATTLATLPPKATAVGTKEDKSNVMSDETGKRMVAILEKILAKEGHVKMDGQILSTHLARNTEFHGGFGTNKVA